ncbi:MAG: 3-deoxy-D-manno-octulosonic acid transferase [Tannerellaceae bacterium]|jgi:3-deoxy-D-manno-octulosonic-acid transferase|nr:3-deoxy-D-manno-octulosonic acid transferase [Tannerellaceae bacterium]
MYSLLIHTYVFLVRIAACFGHKKGRLLLEGQRRTWDILKEKVNPSKKYIWCHAASAGEFEQGKPLIEAIRRKYPQYGILLTFFSPSGYEVKKNYTGADIVCYLPFDTPKRVKRFFDTVSIVAAVFVKYEVWGNYLSALQRKGIPAYLVSAVFRKGQLFFRRYGRPYAKMLLRFTRIFVQDEDSQSLLSRVSVKAVTVAGDIRFDRVVEIQKQSVKVEAVEKLRKQAEGKGRVLVAGSTWPEDEDILISYFNAHPELFLALAPHEIDEERLKRLEKKLQRPSLRLSAAMTNVKKAENADCLLVDNYGLLSSLYRYGDMAYVGGGFGDGIHNTLEAAVYGIPVFFGPNYFRFREARELVACGGAFPVEDYQHLETRLTKLVASDHVLMQFGQAASNYVRQNTGATERVLERLAIP